MAHLPYALAASAVAMAAGGVHPQWQEHEIAWNPFTLSAARQSGAGGGHASPSAHKAISQRARVEGECLGNLCAWPCGASAGLLRRCFVLVLLDGRVGWA